MYGFGTETRSKKVDRPCPSVTPINILLTGSVALANRTELNDVHKWV
jgi:hypothetical protein